MFNENPTSLRPTQSFKFFTCLQLSLMYISLTFKLAKGTPSLGFRVFSLMLLQTIILWHHHLLAPLNSGTNSLQYLHEFFLLIKNALNPSLFGFREFLPSPWHVAQVRLQPPLFLCWFRPCLCLCCHYV